MRQFWEVTLTASILAVEDVGFELRDVESIREDYMMALQHWVSRLEAHRAAAIRATDETTCRVWPVFMSSATHGFDIGLTNVYIY